MRGGVHDQVYIIEEVLVCRRDTRSCHNLLPGIATCKGTTLVGHTPYLDGYVRIF